MRTEPLAPAPGRTGQRAGDTETTLAIDVGATRTRLAIVRDGAIAARVTSPTAALVGPDGWVTSALAAAALDLAREAGGHPVQAIGIGLAAFVAETGSVLQPRAFGIPGGTAVRDALADAFGVPVSLDNDANLAALAEARLGVAVGRGTVAVITLGTNIGLGLLIDGRIHRGAHGAAGEAGLLLVPAQDVAGGAGGRRVVDAGSLGRATSEAPSGYAHIEELVGGGALAAAGTNDRTGGGAPAGAPTTPYRVLTRGAHGGPLSESLAERAVEGWALLMADLCMLLDPELVVLTGGLAQDADYLLEPLRRRVAELAPLPAEIRLGSVGPDAELLGADLVARSALVPRAVGHARAGLSAQSRGGDR